MTDYCRPVALRFLFPAAVLARFFLWVLVPLFVTLLLPRYASAEASPAAAELQKQLQDINALQGRFEQTVETVGGIRAAGASAGGESIDASSGTFKLLQPGFFFWRITEPDEQLLIAAGDSLWHYDVELETATRRNIAAERSQSPLAVLSASEEQLQELYAVEQLSAQRFSLEPRFDGAGFVRLELTLDEGVPATMAVMDHLQQITQIRFFDITLNPHLMADEFSFIPPDGVDVYVQ